MAAKKFLRLISGIYTEVFGVQTSSGVANAGDVVALNDDGQIDDTMIVKKINEDDAFLYSIMF